MKNIQTGINLIAAIIACAVLWGAFLYGVAFIFQNIGG